MACEHKRIKCVNCEFICVDCGAKIEPVPAEDCERVTSASGRKIGFDAEKPKRKTTKRKGAAAE